VLQPMEISQKFFSVMHGIVEGGYTPSESMEILRPMISDPNIFGELDDIEALYEMVYPLAAGEDEEKTDLVKIYDRLSQEMNGDNAGSALDLGVIEAIGNSREQTDVDRDIRDLYPYPDPSLNTPELKVQITAQGGSLPDSEEQDGPGKGSVAIFFASQFSSQEGIAGLTEQLKQRQEAENLSALDEEARRIRRIEILDELVIEASKKLIEDNSLQTGGDPSQSITPQFVRSVSRLRNPMLYDVIIRPLEAADDDDTQPPQGATEEPDPSTDTPTPEDATVDPAAVPPDPTAEDPVADPNAGPTEPTAEEP